MIAYVLTKKTASRKNSPKINIYSISARVAGLPVTTIEDISIHWEIVLSMAQFFSFMQMPPHKLKAAVAYLLSVERRLWEHIVNIA